jgi:uncharacterized phage protein (TIGR02220 family)
MHSWCKVASNLDSHPKIRRGGRNAREVFLFALRRNSEPGNAQPGSVPAPEMEPWYLADQLMMTETEAADGLSRCDQVGLLIRDGDRVAIVGWEEEWGKRPLSGSERTAKWRKNTGARDGVTPRDESVTEPSSTSVTGDGCDGSEEIRSDQKRGEEKRDQVPPKAPQRGAVPLALESPGKRPRPRKPKPSEPSSDERGAALRVLEKLGAQNGIAYEGGKEHVGLIVARIRDGTSEMDLRKVVGFCALELGWREDDSMRHYLRPETLFGPKTIAKYLDPARAWFLTLPANQHRTEAA